MPTGNYLDRWLGYSVRRELLDETLDDCREIMTGEVLEVGNGRVARRGRFVPPGAPQVSSWKFLDKRPEVSPDVCADLLAIPLTDGSFDTVVCLEVLEYVSATDMAIREMGRVLKTGGKLIASVPFLHRCDSPADLLRFTENGLRKTISEAGFSKIEIVAQGGALATAAGVLKHAVRMVPSMPLRLMAALAAWAPLELLILLDRPACRWMEDLRSFSTGYLVIAVKEGR
jgi:SAM-dependent methyltransferase